MEKARSCGRSVPRSYRRSAQLATTCSENQWLCVVSSGAVPTVPEEPYQPLNYNFPRREFGQKTVVNRSFQSSWFIKWKWLHYESSRDVVYCHTCVTGVNSSKLKLTDNAKESAFIYAGFSNWKDATRCFNKH